MLANGCMGFLALDVDKNKQKLYPTEGPVVRKFAEVFFDELPGLPAPR